MKCEYRLLNSCFALLADTRNNVFIRSQGWVIADGGKHRTVSVSDMERHGSAPFGHLLLARYERGACDAYFEIAYFIISEMIPSHVLSRLTRFTA